MHRILVGNQREMTTLGHGFLSFLVYLVTILYYSYIVWSKDLSACFLCFLPIFDREFSFFFAFSHSLIGESSPFAFFRFFDREFSPFALFSFEGKVYGELGFWLKAYRTTVHDIGQGVGLASGSGIKGISHIISMTHMQQ